MNLASAIEGGLAGASTLTLLQEAITAINPKSRPGNLLRKPGILRKVKKYSKKGKNSNKLYIDLATELLTGAVYFGLTGIGKKKNALLRGALLGAGAGLATIIFKDQKDQNKEDENGESNDLKKHLLTLTLYTAGGLLAGAAVKKWGKKK